MKVRVVLWAAVIAGCGGVETAGSPCSSAAACDDMNACTTDTCESRVCVHKVVPDGDEAAQTPGDCKRLVCAGGVEASVIDPTDVASDGNDCTLDTCAADGTSAHTAVPQSTPCMVAGYPGTCDAFAKCLASDCAGGKPPCNDANPCTTDGCTPTGECDFIPIDGVLVPGLPQVAGDCTVEKCVSGIATPVADDTDVPTTANDCVTPICTAGTPSLPAAKVGTACNTSGGKVCDGNGACVVCNVDTDCVPPATCTGNPKKCQ